MIIRRSADIFGKTLYQRNQIVSIVGTVNEGVTNKFHDVHFGTIVFSFVIVLSIKGIEN